MKFSGVKEYLDVKATPLKPAAGRILISVPFYNDPFFNRTVVLLVECSENNCVGLIINQQIKFKINQIIKDIDIDEHIYAGGPVMHNNAFGLHNYPYCEDCSEIVKNVYLGYNDRLISILEKRFDSSVKYKFFIGYSGWAPNQLEEEIHHQMWVVSRADEQLILHTPPDLIWEHAVKELGDEYLHWLKIPVHLSDN
ncbi:MAG: YqgE/AlgH family protein [Bacteroidales bacterium]|nr:YqgE/AlgH family protein [Bacteroidales bacterium]